jgi:hypothetical protein
LNLECVAIINDNVGVLMAGAQKDAKCRVGLILGKTFRQVFVYYYSTFFGFAFGRKPSFAKLSVRVSYSRLDSCEFNVRRSAPVPPKFKQEIRKSKKYF